MIMLLKSGVTNAESCQGYAVADRIKQVFGVKVRLPSDDDRLRAGMAADVYFPNVK